MPSPVKDIKGNNLIRDETMDVSEIERALCQCRALSILKWDRFGSECKGIP